MSSTTIDFQPSLEFARELDTTDPLAWLRSEFHMPPAPDGGELVYLTGNSLGLQPKGVRAALEVELEDWAQFGVEGHFEARNPWFSYHERFREPAARLVGALPGEVVVMNTLTTNLHLMMVSFYRPTPERHKIIIEGSAFPSDIYAVGSQVRFHGYDPEEAIILLKPRDGENEFRTGDIEALLQEQGAEVALVMLGGVNFYSGQAFDMKRITAAAHAAGAVAGFDLAHAAGNLLMYLHDWDVDFAVWCTYKYLNSGPGGVSGCFVHERHAFAPELPRFAGWWGNDPETRFTMRPEFVPQHGAAGWQLSNAQVMPMAVHAVALELFDRVGMPALREKSERMTGYLEYLLNEASASGGGDAYQIITPTDPAARGCQLSIRVHDDARSLGERLKNVGVIADYRPPDVIRVAPVPMYNSFQDVWRFVAKLREVGR